MLKPKILVIEDEEGIREGLVEILSPYFDVKTASNGLEGLKKSFKENPDLIILDLKMPELDGFQVCKAIRNEKDFIRVPIIILSAFNNITDRTKLFEIGADDYITKPFDRAELIARVKRAVTRNTLDTVTWKPIDSASGIIKLGEMQIDSITHKVFIGNKQIVLSALEFKLLYLLAKNLNQIVTREQMLAYVWEKQKVSARLIDPHILGVREKIYGYPYSIEAIYGKGYILKEL